MNLSGQTVWLALAAILAVNTPLSLQPQVGAADNVILITLDGARVEEMFTGLNLEILRSTLKQGQKIEDLPVYRRFWAEDSAARREKLMPFFWRTLMVEHASYCGKPAAWQHRPSHQPSSVFPSGSRRCSSRSPRRGDRGTILIRNRIAPSSRWCRAPGAARVRWRRWHPGHFQRHRGARRVAPPSSTRPAALARPGLDRPTQASRALAAVGQRAIRRGHLRGALSHLCGGAVRGALPVARRDRFWAHDVATTAPSTPYARTDRVPEEHCGHVLRVMADYRAPHAPADHDRSRAWTHAG